MQWLCVGQASRMECNCSSALSVCMCGQCSRNVHVDSVGHSSPSLVAKHPPPPPHTLPPNLPPPTHLTPPTLPSQPMASQWLAGSVKVEVCRVCVACTASHEVLSLEHLWCQEVRLQMCSVHPFSLCTRQMLFVHCSL